jgi:hypothetical protein
LISDNLSAEGKNLLLNIAMCRDFKNFASGQNPAEHCAKILNLQKNIHVKDYHLPEPWSGDLEGSRILFVSSNPSIDEHEISPTFSWRENPDKILEYFVHRFDEEYGWTYNLRAKKRLADGSEGLGNQVKYWVYIKGWMDFILRNNYQSFEMGRDYVITEIVHCKSQKEIGVNNKSISACTTKYLDKIIELFSKNACKNNNKIIVSLGAKATSIINQRYNLSLDWHHALDKVHPRATTNYFEDVYQNAGQTIKRLWIAIPHSNYRGKRSIEDCLHKEEMKVIWTYLGVK